MQVQHAACIMVVRPLKCVASWWAAQGQVLNQTSAWWMEATQHIVPNALLAVPDPNGVSFHNVSLTRTLGQ